MMFPLPFEVTRIRRIHTNRVDSLGNDVVVDDADEHLVRVAGWAVRSADEPKLAGHDRRTVDVELLPLWASLFIPMRWNSPAGRSVLRL